VIRPVGEMTQVSPLAAQRTRLRRHSTARNCASRRCPRSVSGAMKHVSLTSDTKTFAPAATSDRAAAGTMSS
jgi:hypothetical protein